MSTLVYTESPLDPATAIYDFTLPAGDGWMHEIKKGQRIRVVDLEGNQAVDTLFYNAQDMSDRYSAQDTIREQCEPLSHRGHEAHFERRPYPAHDRGRYLRASRHHWRRLCRGK